VEPFSLLNVIRIGVVRGRFCNSDVVSALPSALPMTIFATVLLNSTIIPLGILKKIPGLNLLQHFLERREAIGSFYLI